MPPSPPDLPSRARSRSRRTATEEMRPAGARARRGRGPARGSPHTRRPALAELNPPGRLRGHHLFTSQRFHALLNSLFKVLFNFPLRYLLTIGLVPVFSLRWSLPPALGCIRKQPDSEETVPRGDEGRSRPHTVRGWEPLSEGLRPPIDTRATAVSYTPHVPRPGRAGIRRWALPSSLAATGGILVSFFSSA